MTSVCVSRGQLTEPRVTTFSILSAVFSSILRARNLLPRGIANLPATRRIFSRWSRAKKQLAMRGSLGSEVNRLTAKFLEVCEASILYRDHSRHEVHEVLRAVLACEEVYRTYAREPNEVSREDERLIAKTIAAAKEYRPDLDLRLFDFLRDILRLRVPNGAAVELAMRFQQTSAAVMAKGVEDTAFYSSTG